MNKIIRNDSFDFGGHFSLATIADDPAVMRKCASSAISDQWGKISPIKDHTIIHLIALGSFEKTGCNRNGDAFSENVCKAMHPSFKKHGALYRDHKSEDYGKRNGDVIKTAYNDAMGRVELAVACHHDKCGHFLPKIEKGEPVSFSMGFKCAHDVCSICQHKAKTRAEYCEHVQKNAIYPNGMGVIRPDGRKNFVFNPEGFFNDISDVPVGADQIAMDLRKVASLSPGEVISGAELAERYFITDDALDINKVAVVRKAAEIEKRIDMIGQSVKKAPNEKTLTKVAIDSLRALPVKDMMNELVKVSAVLPIVDFYQLVFGPEFSKYAETIESASVLEKTAFSKIASDHTRLSGVCSNNSYDPNKNSYANLDHSVRRELVSAYSIDPDISEYRAIKRASETNHNEAAVVIPTEQLNYLVDQYCAYKVAALLAINPNPSEDMIFASLI